MESATAAVALPPAEVHSVPTSDGTEVRLTRYKFGTKGPLVLAPGYGNAARAFAIDTVPKNWVQYLGEHGYDVWLLDYRASPDLPSSFTQFTVDDIAMRDWPAAIDTVRRETGAGHGAGDGPLRRRALAVHGDRRRDAGPALGHVLRARRPPDPDARQPGARLGAHGDDVQDARDQGPEHRLRPEGAGTARLIETRDEGRARSGTSTTTRSRAASTSSTATSSTTRTSTSRRWSRPCRASSATATSRSSSTSR